MVLVPGAPGWISLSPPGPDCLCCQAKPGEDDDLDALLADFKAEVGIPTAPEAAPAPAPAPAEASVPAPSSPKGDAGEEDDDDEEDVSWAKLVIIEAAKDTSKRCFDIGIPDRWHLHPCNPVRPGQQALLISPKQTRIRLKLFWRSCSWSGVAGGGRRGEGQGEKEEEKEEAGREEGGEAVGPGQADPGPAEGHPGGGGAARQTQVG
jgi:hypothetical protein